MPLLTDIERYVARRDKLRPSLLAFCWLYGSGYDLVHGVATTRRSARVGDGERRRYEAICGWHLRAGLPPGSVAPTDVFADVGSGKGRGVLLAASRYPFARVIGVEREPDLHRRAQDNLARWRGPRLRPVELVHADALDWQLPADVTVVLLFNPFVGSTFERFVARLATELRDRPRPFRLVYVNARMHEAVVAAGFTFTRRSGRVALYTW